MFKLFGIINLQTFDNFRAAEKAVRRASFEITTSPESGSNARQLRSRPRKSYTDAAGGGAKRGNNDSKAKANKNCNSVNKSAAAKDNGDKKDLMVSDMNWDSYLQGILGFPYG